MGIIYLLLAFLDLFLNLRFLLGLIIAVGFATIVDQTISNQIVVRSINLVILIIFVGGGFAWQLKHRKKREKKIQEKITKWMKETFDL